jgi:hypothetical protein
MKMVDQQTYAIDWKLQNIGHFFDVRNLELAAALPQLIQSRHFWQLII